MSNYIGHKKQPEYSDLQFIFSISFADLLKTSYA